MPQPEQWHPLDELREQYELNVSALRSRNPQLAAILDATDSSDLLITGDVQRIVLGERTGPVVTALPNPVTPQSASQIASKLYPGGKCTEPALVAGLDHGWLWQRLYDLEIDTPRTPGHRPPLYFVARDLQRLRAVMHFHDWRNPLADSRVRIFAGQDALQRLADSLASHPLIPWPRLCVTIDPSVWPGGMSVDSLLQGAQDRIAPLMTQYTRRLHRLDTSLDPIELAMRMSGGISITGETSKLRVLGITSRFTTFLQYSMRDWLAAFQMLGHESHLLIEQGDYEIVNPMEFARVCAEFQPDLILLIDHYRGEFSGLPKHVPCVMWVQDRLSNIFRAQAGAAQHDMDFVLGYGRQECCVSYDYPPERFMPSVVGFNENRFKPRTLGASELEQFGCDVSFVSHASTPPEVLIQQEIDKSQTPEVVKFLRDMLDRLRAIYDAGSFVTETEHIRAMVRASMSECRIETNNFDTILDFFVQRVNNALFRQQAVEWLADMGVKLHLYGRGWERHPKFRQFARGVADNEQQLCAIYQASAINMQITPFGAVHQRLADGLSAGGFFLLRHCTGDVCDRIYQDLWHWISESGIRNGPQLMKQAPPHVRLMLERIVELTGQRIEPIADRFFFGLEELAGGGFTRAPSTLWPGEYGRVSFSTADQLQARVEHFLSNRDERAEITDRMRAVALSHLSYTGITRKLLDFIADNLRARHAMERAA